MKNINSVKNIFLALGLGAMISCSDDFLEVPPEDTVVDANFYKTNDQLLAATAPLYNLGWFDYNDKASYNLGDFRGGSAFSAYNDRENVEFNTTENTPENGAAWRAFYNVVGQSNMTIVNINQYATEGVSEEVKKVCIAEARFMRALAYRYLVMNWEAVPIIENNLEILDNPLVVKRNTVSSIWGFITKEFRAAAADLPETPMLEGRLTKWAAEAMLARTYLTRSGVPDNYGMGASEQVINRNQDYLDSAKYYSQRVIEFSGAALLPSYSDLYHYPYDNNSESLFSLQWVFTDNTAWGTQNSTPAYLTPTSELGNGDGWGGDKGATFYMLSLYEGFENQGDTILRGRTVDARLKATFMLPGMEYDELSFQGGDGLETGYTVPYNAGTPGEAVNFAAVKKYVVGKLAATEAASQRYGHDTYMIRLAEMYLIYAEAALGNNSSTSDALAMEYYNLVHERATNQVETDPLTFDMIYEERLKEFAMEGMAWYDLVRLHYYNPPLAYAKIGEQDRGFYFIQPDQYPDPTEWTIRKTSWDDNRSFNATSGNFRIPLPAAEVSAAPNLLDEPVPYDFSE
ncbi:RagB/SusD family nutrient uptake outer membrane protein [Fulvivirga ligni]|uniref:RagB/SusD family nutrient uptake outer membrane protein n=1 Tax=Fulvivirga ligni TaxID=2904246 RepID=UPI001F228F4E|nr:RagB/SusD family nutrient uptake outer membrane protein [Fulvivirga ligni]UII23702.1 RagB/SusD family nutrient uptake outer membrane protein [Fulvivirga ligni]